MQTEYKTEEEAEAEAVQKTIQYTKRKKALETPWNENRQCGTGSMWSKTFF